MNPAENADAFMRFHPYPRDFELNPHGEYNQLVVIGLRDEADAVIKPGQITYMLMSSSRHVEPRLLTREQYLECCSHIVSHYSHKA